MTQWKIFTSDLSHAFVLHSSHTLLLCNSRHMVTAFTVSEPRHRPSKTFFNVATPTKTKLISPRTGKKWNLASVKKTLEFGSQPLVAGSKSLPSKSHSSTILAPDASIEKEYYDCQKQLSSILRAIPLSQYYISLNGILENSSVIWELIVVVNDDDLENTIESLAGIATKSIRIQCIAGDFTFAVEILDRPDWGMETRPSPGRSIGPEFGQLTSNDGEIDSSGTLGGYVYGKQTRRIFGLTVRHLLISKPNQKLESVISINQPSDPDFEKKVAAFSSACMESSTSEEYEYYKEQLEEIEKHKSTRLFGKVMHAIWSIVPNAFAPPNVNDFALIQIEANCVGLNTLRIPDGAPFDHRVKGVAQPEKNGRVMKIGSVTGFSAGRVSSTQAFIYHEDFGCEISLGHTVDMNVSKGDSGSFMFNSKGEVVGMIVGAVKSSAVVFGSDEIVFSQGCFIIMEDALRWASKALGEEVAIVREPAPATEF